MSRDYPNMTPDLHRYAVGHSEQDERLDALGRETDALGPVANMQMAPEQAALMTVLVESMGARRALEIGTFTGYGSIAIARGLPADGALVTCDVSEEYTAIARRHIESAGLADRIDIRIDPALETLANLEPDPPFDFAFIDADKESYPAYYEEILRLIRPGGLIVVDNVFRNGDVIDDSSTDPDVLAIRELNDTIAADPRLASRAMIGVADGILLATKA